MLNDITTDGTVGTDISCSLMTLLNTRSFLLWAFLTRKYDAQSASDNDNDVQELTAWSIASSDFTQQLDRGGLLIPKLSTVYLVHSAVHIISNLAHRRLVVKYIATSLSYVVAPLANSIMACRTVANVRLKVHVFHHSDSVKMLRCPFIFSPLHMLKLNRSISDTSRQSYMRMIACGIRRHQNCRIGPSLFRRKKNG